MSETTDRIGVALAGRYRIEREVGEGGMATVHLAEDLRHGRKVALKVLRPELAAILGAERFIQEIKTTAGFQHPHILPLFDSGEADGFLYYVMPFIDGETLRDRLARETQLSIEDAVRITIDIAGALDYAHRHHVIHRDIKPENILLHDGRPLVADFGIALAVSAAGGARLTETGLRIGTPNYMSPEQATGEKDVTPRSDIYALGSMLYEMLTGEPPLTGGSTQTVIMKIVAEEVPPVTNLRKSVPPHVSAAVAKALEKLAADRFDTAKDFADALANPHFRHAGAAVAATAASSHRSTAFVGIAAVALLASILAAWGWLRPGDEPAAPVSRYSILLPAGQMITREGGRRPGRIALTPDGSRLVYVGEDQPYGGTAGSRRLWIRSMDQLESTPLEGSDGAGLPFISPDGERVGFQAEGRLRVLPLRGGPPLTLSEEVVGPGGAGWSPDGYVYADDALLGGLVRVPEQGGSLERFTTLDSARAESDHQWPEPLPNGRGVLFVIRHGSDDDAAEIAVADVATGAHRVLSRGLHVRYAASGHLLYVTADGTLMARAFDQKTWAFRGEATAFVRGLSLQLAGPSVAPDLALSATGTLLYLAGEATTRIGDLVWVGRDGSVREAVPGWSGRFQHVALSPDGEKVAVAVEEAGRVTQIWIKGLIDGSLFKLTSVGSLNFRPEWTPDGSAVAFTTERDGGLRTIYQQRTDGTPAVKLLDDQRNVQEVQFSDDGRWLAYRVGGGPASDLYVRRRAGDSTPIATAASVAEEALPRPSPDGRWLAYQSNETGSWEIWVRPMAEPGGRKWQVSTQNGGAPLFWAHSGRELFYRDRTTDSLIAVQAAGEGGFALGSRKALFAMPGHALAAIAPDDQRFLAIRRVGGAEEPPELIVVENFFEELRATAGR